MDGVLQVVGDLGPTSAVDTLRGPIEQLVQAPTAGFALIIGIAGALWSASGYVGAFGRAMNRMYEVEEGRPVWKLRPVMLLVTLIALILIALAAVMLAPECRTRTNKKTTTLSRRDDACTKATSNVATPDNEAPRGRCQRAGRVINGYVTRRSVRPSSTSNSLRHRVLWRDR